ncbi:hypothetical protein [Pseudonocardia spinosispora]|uniref:hypothetical protein n=1 Tax=Pseudonocardia spinosispora TaxID=103441 RepID=UPI00042518DC|nr:hypothetical protein [Pseudonocardia spinosispora]
MPKSRTSQASLLALATLAVTVASLAVAAEPGTTGSVLAGRDVVVYDDNPAEGEQTCAFYRRQDPTTVCTVRPTSERPLIRLGGGDRTVAQPRHTTPSAPAL